MNQNLLSRVLEFLQRKMWNKRWQRAVTCLAAVAVFGVTYALILPAITMTGPHPEISTEKLTAWSGDGLTMHVKAETAENEHDKVYILSMDETGADLAEKYEFSEEGTVLVAAKGEADEEVQIELHRIVREDARADQAIVDYWFTLDAGTKVEFDLDLVDEVDETRFSEIVETVNRSAGKEDASEEAPDATASNAAAANKEAAGKASDATASNAEKASGSNADVAEANAIAKEEEKIVVEKDDDGFEQILDGAIVNDLDQDEEDGVQTEITARLKVSAGSGEDLEAAQKDADRNADKRENAQLKFQWKTEVTPQPDMVWSENGANIAVFYDDDAEIPENSVLDVREIQEGTEEYAQLLGQTENTVKASGGANQSVKNARFFDITILDADGNEVEPTAPVKVVITYDEPVEVAEDGNVNVLHFKDDAPEVITPNTGDGNNLEALSFTAESFSVYAVYTTEELKIEYLSSDGNTYEVTLTYGPEAGIPDGSRLSVGEFSKNSSEYELAYNSVVGQPITYKAIEYSDSDPYEVEYVYSIGDAQNLAGLSVLDISIIGPDGAELEPAAPVDVKIEVKKLDDAIDLDIKRTELEQYDISVIHMKEQNGNITTEQVADNSGKNPGVVEVKQDVSENPVVAEFKVASFSKFVFKFNNTANGGSATAPTPHERKYTVHYGYMDGSTFNEFPAGSVSMEPNGFSEDEENDAPYWNGNATGDNVNLRRQYLVYDVEIEDVKYVYQETYYSATEVEGDPTAQTRIYPTLYKENNMCYFPWKSDGSESGGKGIDNDSHIYVIYEAYAPTDAGHSEIPPGSVPKPEDLEGEPEHHKTLEPVGDGTYRLSLDVKGKTLSRDEKTKADVIVIMDRSGSMASNYTVNGVKHNRWEWSRLAIYDLVDSLFEQNVAPYTDTTRVAVITFANTATIDVNFTQSKKDITDALDPITVKSGTGSTNWEYPLILANSLEVRDDAETYVIFVSDGTPNYCVSRGNNLSDKVLYQHGQYASNNSTTNGIKAYLNKSGYNASGLFGTGSDNHMKAVDFSLAQAVPAGRKIVGKGKHLYIVGGYSSATSQKVKYMKKFTNRVYGNDPTTDSETGEYVDAYFKSGESPDALTEAFNQIISSINAAIGFTGIHVDDGITENTNLNAKTPVLQTDANFTYTRSGGSYDDAQGNPTPWSGAPAAKYENGSVIWDLGNTLLEDGVTYTVSFIVWPNQAAYDLVSDVNNAEDPEAYYNALSEEQKKIIHFNPETKQCTLSTNEDDPSLTYKKYVYDPTKPQGQQYEYTDPVEALPYENPEPVPLTKSQMTVQKTWNDTLDPTQLDEILEKDPDYTVAINVYRQIPGSSTKELYRTVQLNRTNNWSSTFFISPGLNVGGTWNNSNKTITGGTNYNSGYVYTIEEPDIDYHFELRPETVQPMLLNSASDVKLVGDTNGDGALTANNDLKGGINITKTIVHSPSNATMSDAEQEFTVNGKILDMNGNAYTGDNMLRFRVYDDTGRIGEDEDDRIHSADDGTFTFNIKAGQTFRIVNVPAGSTWEFTEDETALTPAYLWEKIEADYLTKDKAGNETHTPIDIEGKTAAGEVRSNRASNVHITNRKVEYNVDVLKTDESGNPENKLKGATFQLYSDEECANIAKDVNGDDCQPVTTGEDGIAHIGDLGVGTYYLKETMAPNGFILLTDPIEITVDKTNGVTYKQKDYAASESGESRTYNPETNTWTITVVNNHGVELPHTGGPGTTFYTLSGLMLLIASALLYGFRRRHEERRSA